MKKGKRYDRDYPRRLYAFFTRSVEEGSIPSFSKFARSIGVTLEALEGYRSNKTFDRAWRDCIEIRRDYLTDSALTRRYDPSFVKFLLDREYTEGEDNNFSVSVKVEDA